MTPDTREKLTLIADDVDWIVAGESGPAHDNALRLISKRLRELAAPPVASDGWQLERERLRDALDRAANVADDCRRSCLTEGGSLPGSFWVTEFAHIVRIAHGALFPPPAPPADAPQEKV